MPGHGVQWHARRGLTHGVVHGLPVPFSSGGDCTCPFAGINAYAAVKRPQTEDQWACVGTGVTTPVGFWNCQETSGNLTDMVNGMVLTAVGAVGYSGSVTDWNTSGCNLWVRTTSETANQGFYVDKDTSPMQGWNASVSSIFVVGYSVVTNSTAERILFVLSGTTATSVYIAITAAGVLKIYDGATPNATGAVVYENATPTPFAWALQWDNRGSGLMRLTSKKLGTGAETLSATPWANRPDGGKGLNVDVGGSPPIGMHNMLAVWTGAEAEAMMDRGGANTGGATIITDLGW